MEQLNAIFSKLKTRTGQSLRPLTVNNYTTKINKLSQIVNGSNYDGNNNWMLKPENVLDKLQATHLKSQKDYISPVVKLLYHLKVDENIIKRYNTDMTKLKSAEDDIRKDNKASDKEKQNAIPLKDINKAIDMYSIKDSKDNIDDNKLICKLIVCLYFKNELIARNNYYNMKIATTTKKLKDLNPKFNYLIVSKDMKPLQFIMLNYKTSEKYGMQKFSILDDTLKKLLELYLSEWKRQPGEFLFVMNNGNEFKPTNYSNLIEQCMQKVLGKPLNIDLIRKIHITEFTKNGLKSENEKEAFARRLLHSANVQREYVKTDLYEEYDKNNK
jgi:hypothetical protein